MAKKEENNSMASELKFGPTAFGASRRYTRHSSVNLMVMELNTSQNGDLKFLSKVMEEAYYGVHCGHDGFLDATLDKLILNKNCYFVESPFLEVLKTLLRDVIVARPRICLTEDSNIQGGSMFTVNKGPNELEEGSRVELLTNEEFAATVEEKETHSVETYPT
eukprot:Gb_18458 [translate_table: standard]